MISEIYKTTPNLEKIVKQTGYETTGSLLFLHRIAKNVRPSLILELGTGYGCSAIFMALGSGNKVISIDDYRGDITTKISDVEKNIYDCYLEEKIDLVEDKSVNIPNDVEYPEIVFMDASHDNTNLWEEYTAFKPYLPKDHLIIVDDSYSPMENFLWEMSRIYPYCLTVKLHNGLSIFATSAAKYKHHINAALEGLL